MKKIITLLIVFITLISVSVSPVYALGEITGPDIIYKENNEIVSISDITALYSASGGAIIVEEDGFTGHGHLIGNKTVKLTATDGFIEKTKEITIVVTSNKIPDDGETNLFKVVGRYSDSYVFVTDVTKVVTIEKVRDTLINLGLLTIVEPSSKNVILDTYTDKKTEPGTYSLNFRIMDATGQVRTFTTSIKVIGTSGDWEDLEPREKLFGFDFDIGSIISIIISLVFSLVIGFAVIYFFITIYKKFVRKGKK